VGNPLPAFEWMDPSVPVSSGINKPSKDLKTRGKVKAMILTKSCEVKNIIKEVS
jgi:hypothetical protein